MREWTGLVAERYYALAEQAIRAADPDALYFGDRLPIYYDPAAVRAMAPHVDAIATNYNVDAATAGSRDYFFDGLDKLSGGKPVLVTEWFFAARENRTGNRNNGHLMTVDTQAERAARRRRRDRELRRASRTSSASHWFQYYDHPKGGRPDGEDYDFGLVDIDDRPYRAADRRRSPPPTAQAPAIHAARRAARAGADSVVRAAARADLDRRPLARRLAEAGEPAAAAARRRRARSISARSICRGATRASPWRRSARIISTSTCWPMTALSRSANAYRVELGVDVGAGPRRFTLFFIPPRTSCTTIQSMTALLCAGAADEAIRARLHGPMAGAEAVYFGADQPRITAEMLIPWSALGIAAAAAGRDARAPKSR